MEGDDMKSGKRILGAGMIAASMMLGARLDHASAGGFDAERWKAQRGLDLRDNPRQGMMREVRALLHPGLSKAEVLNLLGEPDRRQDNRFEYDLGMRPLGIDYQSLVLDFDASGRLLRFRTVQG